MKNLTVRPVQIPGFKGVVWEVDMNGRERLQQKVIEELNRLDNVALVRLYDFARALNKAAEQKKTTE